MTGGRERQADVFLRGAIGRSARVPFDPTLLKQRAEEVMSKQAFAYVAGGAGAEETMRANRRDLRAAGDRPIQLGSRDEEWRMTAAMPYCQMWLQRYAPDLAVPAIARRTVLLLAAVAPAVLLPATLRAFVSDLASARPWLGRAWLVLIVAGAIAVLNSLREGSTLALYTFYQFVLVQFVDEGKPRFTADDNVRGTVRN